MQERDLVHRDVKLENIFLRQEKHGRFTFKVGDFGFTRHAKVYTGCSTLCGTPTYMAPEVALTPETRITYGQQADVWSLGISLFMLLTGQEPYDEDDLAFQVKLGCVSWTDVTLEPSLRRSLENLLTVSSTRRPRMRSLFLSRMSDALGV